MADKKISQLDASALPLAGTEVLPIVQSGATKKVASNDLTVKNVRSNATTGILQIAGPTAAATRTMTVPDANFTAARTDTGQTFSGDQNFAQAVIVTGGITGHGANRTTLSQEGANGAFWQSYGANASTMGSYLLRQASSDFSVTNIPFFISAVGGVNFGGTTDAGAGNVRIDNGNVVIGTAGKGIDFTQDPNPAGMTSELLDDYEEGTWTPTDLSGAGLTFTIAAARYTKIGRTVFVQAQITYPSTASVATVLIGGLPFTSSADSRTGISLGYNTFAANYLPFVSASSALMEFFVVAGSGAQATNVNLSTLQFAFSGFYTV